VGFEEWNGCYVQTVNRAESSTSKALARKGESKTLPSFVDNKEKSFSTKFSRSTQIWKDDRDDMLEVMLRGNEVIAPEHNHLTSNVPQETPTLIRKIKIDISDEAGDQPKDCISGETEDGSWHVTKTWYTARWSYACFSRMTCRFDVVFKRSKG
jgi:hypothetical protein